MRITYRISKATRARAYTHTHTPRHPHTCTCAHTRTHTYSPTTPRATHTTLHCKNGYANALHYFVTRTLPVLLNKRYNCVINDLLFSFPHWLLSKMKESRIFETSGTCPLATRLHTTQDLNPVFYFLYGCNYDLLLSLQSIVISSQSVQSCS